jgi:hypothetical protein
MRLIRVAASLLVLGTVAIGGEAAASPAAGARATSAHAPAPAVPSADAGYAVTGKHLNGVEPWVTLPRADRFARWAGRIGVSLQLWTSTYVLDLRISACTDTDCRPGGRPAFRSYHAVLDVYNRSTHALICSTVAHGSLRCPAPIGRFSTVRIAPGSTFQPFLSYVAPYSDVEVAADTLAYFYPLPAGPTSRPLADFTQARVVAEFGTSPWARPDLLAPPARLKVVSFDRPTPPPYEAEIVNTAGKAGGISAPWWHHHRVSTRPGRGHATASSLWDDGYGITIYLQ